LNAHYGRLPTDALRVELGRLLGFTAENLLRLAVVVTELERRGDDLGDLKIGLLPYLRDIAAGTLLPEIVVLCSGRRAVLRRTAALPVGEQALVVSGARPAEEPPSPRKVRGPNSLAGPRGRPRPAGFHHEDKEADNRPNIGRMAAQSSPRDLGEMAAELIGECADPRLALERMLESLADKRLLPHTVSAEVGRQVLKRRPKLVLDVE
jgi:hypothetical protein